MPNLDLGRPQGVPLWEVREAAEKETGQGRLGQTAELGQVSVCV